MVQDDSPKLNNQIYKFLFNKSLLNSKHKDRHRNYTVKLKTNLLH